MSELHAGKKTRYATLHILSHLFWRYQKKNQNRKCAATFYVRREINLSVDSKSLCREMVKSPIKEIDMQRRNIQWWIKYFPISRSLGSFNRFIPFLSSYLSKLDLDNWKNVMPMSQRMWFHPPDNSGTTMFWLQPTQCGGSHHLVWATFDAPN